MNWVALVLDEFPFENDKHKKLQKRSEMTTTSTN